MFRQRKEVVLTGRCCEKINMLLLAMEVLFGERTYLKRLDFNSGKGQLQVGEKIVGVLVEFFEKDRFYFYLDEEMGGDRHIARFDGQPGEVRIIKTSGPADGQKSMWIVGRSAEARWEEPLFY